MKAAFPGRPASTLLLTVSITSCPTLLMAAASRALVEMDISAGSYRYVLSAGGGQVRAEAW